MQEGSMKMETFSPKQAYLYLTIIYTISYTTALYALALFYLACRDMLQPFNPVPKFIIIKSVVFLTYWQARCTLCSAEIETGPLIPNLALRAAAAAVKHEDDRRFFHNVALRKCGKDVGDQMDPMRRLTRENGYIAGDDGLQRGVQYPFIVNEKVIIKGNRRTPDKFVGKEAIITSQCLNGW